MHKQDKPEHTSTNPQTSPQIPMGGLSYLRWPGVVLGLCLFVLIAAALNLSNFRFDASSDTLVVEGDADLLAYQEVVAVFGGDDFLFLTFEPNNKRPITPDALAVLEKIVSEVDAVTGVSGVFSVLDAPLLKSPPVSLGELLDGFPTLKSPGVDFELAQDELKNSPFFRELLITNDGAATAIKIDLASNLALQQADQKLKLLRQTATSSALEIEAANLLVQQLSEAHRLARDKVVADIRTIRSKYQQYGTLHLGGVPMIAADMIAYVKSDLSLFGGIVVLLIIVALGLFFRRVRWVFLPLATATLSVIYAVGFIGFLGWQATVISSNFISLLGITTASLTIHLIVQYRELLHTQPDLPREALVFETMRSKFAPCFYTAITTIAAFGSLTVSGILPVEYFGWMMCIGIIISFLTTFTFFPAVLLIIPKGKPSSNLGDTNNLIRALGEMVRWKPGLITVVGGIVAVTAAFGIARVSLDNRFAEYFDTDTEIYQGMRYIDQKLGGTIPFDVVLTFPAYGGDEFGDDEFGDEEFQDGDFSEPELNQDLSFEDDFDTSSFEDDFGSDFGDGFDDEQDAYPERYWFNRRMLDRLESMHRFLEAQPQVGKVISLTALEDFARDFTDGKKLSNLEIVAILGAIPPELNQQIIKPYANPASGELRLAGRIIESADSFDREEFRQQILSHAGGELRFADEAVKVTGMMVLFNSMLSQLLDSQLNTLGYILAVVFILFLILLRSLPYALLGMVPNILASATVIGAMGYAGIPLDMMTITIAAICIGIGVDDTIHYLHRFREEYNKWGDARIAVSFTHASIGRALYYTSVTVVAGFSVLCLSNFVPTVMFGLWTAIAMVLALLANITLLPALLVLTHASKPKDPTLREDLSQHA